MVNTLILLMLSIYILILNYNFVSFLVFWSHFYVHFICFLIGYKGYESPRNNTKNLQKWMQIVSQGKEYSLQRGTSGSKRQLSNPSQLAVVKISLTAVNLHGPDPLEHETLGYKRESSSHFWRKIREKTARTHF